MPTQGLFYQSKPLVFNQNPFPAFESQSNELERLEWKGAVGIRSLRRAARSRMHQSSRLQAGMSIVRSAALGQKETV